jgi:hypothetical protein
MNDEHPAVLPGSAVTVTRISHPACSAEGIIAHVEQSGRAVGLRIAGAPNYAEGERVVIVDLETSPPWAVDAAFSGHDREVALFVPLTAWYQRRARPRYLTRTAVTLVIPGTAYMERGVTLDISEGGLRVLVPEEPTGQAVKVLIKGGPDVVPLYCRIVRTAYCDEGVEVHLSFAELTAASRKFVHRRVEDLRQIAEQGRDLLAS